jgi:hypothetical protein
VRAEKRFCKEFISAKSVGSYLGSSLLLKKIGNVFLPVGVFRPQSLWCSGGQRNLIMPLRHGLVVSSPPATVKIGAVGREIESRQGIGWQLLKTV